MKKTLIKISASAIVLLSLFQQVSFASFSDVPETNQNYEAINYLQEQNIINGYQDGTFKPNQSVNRAEFLKIIIEGSKIEPNVSTPSPFPDVDHNQWYGKYIKHAYASGWINGYPDGTFKPEQTINKVEALKILAKVQNWVLNPFINDQPFNDTPLNEWYIPYLAYAKSKNFIEETGAFFEPSKPMTRSGISEVIYRTIKPVNEVIPPTETPIIEEEIVEEDVVEVIEEPEQVFQAHNFELIKADFYEKILLDETIPNTFYKNEVYIIKGSVEDETAQNVTVILNSEDTDDQEVFSSKVTNKKFSIPVHFRKSGNFILGLIPGNSGSSKAVEISVIKELPASSQKTPSGNKVNNLEISYSDDETRVTFDAPSPSLKKLVFTQGEKSVNYLSRQNISQISINYKDFYAFDEEQVNYYIEDAGLSSTKPLEIQTDFTIGSKKQFIPTLHTFDSIVEDKITADPPDTLSGPKSISITGTVKTKTKTKAYITKPDGFVDEVILTTTGTLENQILPAGSNFDLTYSIKKTGTYIFEINNDMGEAIMNHPIYVGEEVAILPDFADLQKKELFNDDFQIKNLRNELLEEINKSRKEHGLGEIILSDELNDLAQAHSDDMKANDYFSHNNQQGKTPEDRRLAAGIKTSVGENLAKDTSIDSAHYGLMRSGAHRKNLLEKEWTRVGLGITLDEGYLIIVEEFSTSEPTAADIVKYKNELLTEINQKRAGESKTSLNTTTQLESASKYLNDKNILEDKSLSNQLFQETLELNNITGTSQAIGRVYNVWTTILESILQDEATEIVNSNWELMGIDIQLDKSGNIHTIIILNNP